MGMEEIGVPLLQAGLHRLPADQVRAAPVPPGRPCQPWENSSDSPFLNTTLEIVAVADASVQGAGTAADVRVPLHEDHSLVPYR
ncbi:hypothetical protein, partial [Bacteroides caccae]|uniref:hypothetical protein n=1 Tax=Bacteroides caccae TaxID=47678 RepID=UPI0012308C72